MDPKDAQEQTEKKWAFLMTVQDEDDFELAPECGWCLFSADLQGTSPVPYCHSCPVLKVFDMPCADIPEYAYYREGRGLDANTKANRAQQVYDLLIANRQALLDAAEEILDERSK